MELNCTTDNSDELSEIGTEEKNNSATQKKRGRPKGSKNLEVANNKAKGVHSRRSRKIKTTQNENFVE